MQAHRKALLAGLAALLLAVPLAGSALAHAYVERSTPADGAELSAPPPEVRITFTEPLETEFSTLTLLDAQEQPVPGTAQAAEGDRTLVLRLPPLPDGVYKVRWQVLSKDTHVTDGSIQFAVGVPLPRTRPAEPQVIGAPPGGSAQPAPSQPPAPPAGGTAPGAPGTGTPPGPGTPSGGSKPAPSPSEPVPGPAGGAEPKQPPAHSHPAPAPGTTPDPAPGDQPPVEEPSTGQVAGPDEPATPPAPTGPAAAPVAPGTESGRPARSPWPWVAVGGLAAVGAAVVALGLRVRRGR
ncbi:MAG: copper resistance protein CopC [Bacillota bacterium]